MKKTLAILGFLGCIPLANWLIQNVGTVCVPNGPCLLPVFPGVMAPSGVLVIGAALVLRDFVHELAGRWVSLACVVGGAALSLLFSPGALALASAAAFLFSEVADWAVYDRLRKRALWGAVLASGLVGAIIDSVLFSSIAFGTVKWAPGLILAKLYASAAVAALFWWTGRRV